MAALRVMVLGQLEVHLDAHRLTPTAPRSRRVLASLASHAGTPISLDGLISEVWGEVAPPSARNTIQSHISRLRSVVGADRLIRHDQSYELCVDEHELDALEFRSACARARSDVRDHRWDEALASYDTGLGLWRGSAFDGFDDVPSCRSWAAELSEQRLLAIEERVDVQLALGRAADAVTELERLGNDHPWRERLWRQRALALYRCDRQAEAVRVLVEFRKCLLSDTGIAVSNELNDLERAILTQDIALKPSTIHREPGGSTGLPVDLHRLDALPMVGRDRARSRVARAWQRVVEGGTDCLLLTGEAGVGKTRLSAAVATDVRGSGGAVRYGRCTERLDLAYQPFAHALRDVDSQAVAALEGERRALDRLIPGLASAGDRSVGEPTDAASGRFVLYEAVASLLARLANPSGLLLVLDDLHWASAQTLGLLEHLLSVARPKRVLVLGTFRDTDAAPGSGLIALTEDLRQRGDAHELRLEGLDSDQIGQLLQLRHLDATSSEVREIHRTTEGNPLLINELIHDARTSAEQRTVGRPRSLTAGAVSAQIARIVDRRLAVLGPERLVLEWAALLGAEFELSVLEAAISGTVLERSVLDALESAESAGLVRELTPGWWQFRHVLTRDALLVGGRPSRIARRHGAIARAIESIYGAGSESQVGRVAHHYCEAAEPGNTTLAAQHSLSAARLRLHQLAPDEALIHVREGIAALARDPEQSQEALADLHLAAAEAHRQVFADADRIEAAELAAAAARRGGLPAHLGRAAVARSAFWTQGDLDEQAVALITEGLQGLGEQDSDLRAELLSHLAGMVAVSGLRGDRHDGRSAVEIAEEAVLLAPTGSPAFASARSSYVVALWDGPNAARQIEVADEIEREGQGDDWLLAARWRAAPRLILGDRPGFESDVELLVTEGARRSWRELHAYGLQCQAMLALMDGHYDEAAVVGARAVDVVKDHPNFSRVFQAQLFWLAVERHELQSMEPFIRAAVEENPELPVFRAMLALCDAHLGEMTEAEALLESSIGDGFGSVPRDVLWLATVGGFAAVAALLRSRRHARVIGPLLDEYRGQLLVVAGGSFVYGAVDRFRAMMAAVIGDTDVAIEAFAQAIELESSVGATPLEARTRWWQAQLLGDPSGVRPKGEGPVDFQRDSA